MISSIRLNSRTAFTLMEMLLVIALLAVISAIALPTVYHDFSRRSKSCMVDSLILELEYARSMGLMDLSDYATFKCTAGSAEFATATQSKILDGNLVFADSVDFAFDSLGRPEDKLEKNLSLKTINNESVGTVIVTPAGLIKRQ